MVPVISVLRAVAAAVLAGAALLGAAPAHATAAHTPVARADGDQVVFTASFIRRIPSGEAAPVSVRAYQVQVDRVYGPVSIPTRRVTVLATFAVERCGADTGVGQGPAGQGQQSQGAITGPISPSEPADGSGAQQEQAPTASPTAEPTDPTASPTPLDDLPRIFEATLDGTAYALGSCDDVMLSDADALVALETELGEGRSPGTTEQPAEPVDTVGYRCDTSADSAELDSPDSCSALESTTSFDRAAAPGLALVIVGVLGLVVARRMGRRRT